MSELVALVELGSNAVRLLLARVSRGEEFRILREERVQTRLGGGPPGHLPRDAVDHTVRAIDRFLRVVRNGHEPRVVAVATAAIRDADNQARLLDTLRRQQGLDVEVLSGRQEARLGVLAVRRTLRFRAGVVADLGGASLELSRVRAGRIVSSASLPLGAVRTTHRFLRHDPPRARELRSLRAAAREALLGSLPLARRGEAMVGVGGTVRTLARIHLLTHRGKRKHRHGLRLQQSDVTAIRERLEPLSAKERRHVRGLKPERADVILAGAIVLEEAMVLGGFLTLVVCTRGVRDGLLFRATFEEPA